MEAALLADGVPPDQLYPLDIDRALKKFDQIKSDILWFTSGAQMIQYYQSGQAVMGLGWDGRIAVLKNSGVPVDYTYDQSLTQWANMIVPKGAPHADAAMKLLAYVTEAKPQARIAEASWYGPINPDAFNYIPKTMASKLSGSPQSLQNGVPINWKWWAENYDSAYAKFTSWQNS
jgi:putative spermidine/putrescine transport system substrate-binding protein